MSRITGPKCKLCRREGAKLFLKGARCETQKCAYVRKNYAPGLHGKNVMKKLTEYGKQLREKQKAKRIFGIQEKQFRIYARKAIKQPGIAGDNLMTILETRADNILYRSGLAESRNQARQLLNHGLLKINDRRVTIPSIKLKVGDKMEVKETSKKAKVFADVAKQKYMPPRWLKVNPGALAMEMATMPEKDDFEKNINTQAIIEFYSK